MRKIIRPSSGLLALLTSFLIVSPPARAADRAADCHGDKRVCQIVIKGEQELASMLVSGDVGIVVRLFADDAIWSPGSGERWTKSEAIAALRNAPRMTSSRLLRTSVYQHGGVAIVLWNETWHDPATNRDEKSFGTDTWMLREAGWQIIASQEARHPQRHHTLLELCREYPWRSDRHATSSAAVSPNCRVSLKGCGRLAERDHSTGTKVGLPPMTRA